MKVCEYCGVECEETERICPSCGGDSFKSKCHNCGTVFDSAACPNCGVKAGESGRICPDCNTRYFSPACPNCGYTPLRQGGTGAYNPPPQTPVNAGGCNKIFWILGWVFLFPVPLTILVVRNKTMKSWLKACIIIVAWAAYLLLGIIGGSPAENDSETSATDSSLSYSETQADAQSE